jgi:hypothetical protein
MTISGEGLPDGTIHPARPRTLALRLSGVRTGQDCAFPLTWRRPRAFTRR